MNDFDYDVKQKKALVSSARRRVSGARSKRCTLPSDYLTKGELKKMNGEVTTINMNEPISYAELVKMSLEVQVQYISHLQEEYTASARMLAECLGISYNATRRYLIDLQLINNGPPGRISAENKARWERFLHKPKGASQLETVGATGSDEASAPTVATVSKAFAEVGQKQKEPTNLDDDVAFNRLIVGLTGTAYAVCKKLLSMIGADAQGTFEIVFTKGGED